MPYSIEPRTLISQVAVDHIDENFIFLEVTGDSIQNVIKSLTKKKARDFFELNLELILIVSDLVTPVLANLINLCFRVGRCISRLFKTWPDPSRV